MRCCLKAGSLEEGCEVGIKGHSAEGEREAPSGRGGAEG